jgi:DNA-binding response OmpR family regulator
MSRGLVLVIEDDEWVSRLLQSAIREAGYDVVTCLTAQSGLEAAFSKAPDCIVCDIDLPDSDGFAVARHVRTHNSRVSVTPFLFLSGLDDEKSRIEGFHVGADVYITKPFRVDEVVAQIDALVQMAARLRQRRDSMLSLPPGAPTGTAIEGDLGQMSIATVLTVLEMERRTGTFEVVSKKRRAQLEIVGGGVTEGTVGGTKTSALTAMRTMLSWNVGRFRFIPAETTGAPPPRAQNATIGAFLIEALRLEDEAARAELELPPSRRRSGEAKVETKVAGPALGGPASSPADFAPPSTRTPKPSELSLLLEPELADWEIPSEEGPRSTREPLVPARPKAIPPPAPPTKGKPLPPPPPLSNGVKPRVADAAITQPTAAPAPPAIQATPPAGGVVPRPPVNVPRPPVNVPRPPPPRPTPQAEKKR